MCNSLKVDPKGRLKIPVTLLSMFKGPGTEFYVTSEDGNSVRIYPMPVWNDVQGQLEHLSIHSASTQKLLARVKYFGEAVTMDKQGRVLIPIVLRNSAQMKGAVDVLDYVNSLEVWNHARLMENLMSSPITPQDEQTLNDVFSAAGSPWAVDWKNREGHSYGKERRLGVDRRMQGNSRSEMSPASRDSRPDPTEHARVA